VSGPAPTILSVWAVFGTDAQAERVALAMVEQRLAACANILEPCRSIYRWKGEVERAEEVPVLFKTSADRADALIAALGRAHSYDVPAIVAWPVASGLPSYMRWVEEESR
jgi:periplasmic divalent cation tolerance protein